MADLTKLQETKKMTTAPNNNNNSISSSSRGDVTKRLLLGNHATEYEGNGNGSGNVVAFVPTQRMTVMAKVRKNFVPAVKAAATKTTTAGEGESGDFFQIGGSPNNIYKVEDHHDFLDRIKERSMGIEQDKDKDYEQLEPNENEPNVYNLPSILSPMYRPIPKLTQSWIGLFSIVTSAISHQSQLFPKVITAVGQSKGGNVNVKTSISAIKFISRVILTSLLSTVFIQESLFSPSRIDTPSLIQRAWLPSPLSKFSTVTAQIDPQLVQQTQTQTHTNSKEPLAHIVGPMGVHYLQYEHAPQDQAPQSNDKTFDFDAVHFNHGFGASSLSWLPAIPSLVDKLGAKIGIAHDAVGFGFTDRPSTARGKKNGLVPYSSAGTAALGNALLLEKIDYHFQESSSSSPSSSASVPSSTKTVALFGHSMGCAATLRMALSLPRDVKKVVVLVAPALLGSTPPSSSTEPGSSLSSSSLRVADTIFKTVQTKVKNTIEAIVQLQPVKIRTWTRVFIASLRKVILDSPLTYILKRLVARSNFWLKGLQLSWGDPNLVTKSDALRFQWPSIGLGWESGLLAFTRSRISSICSYDGGELKLLDDVVQLPNTSLVILHGTKDPVIPVRMSQQIAERLKSSISYIELEGQGHDPFEEGMEDFVRKVAETIGK